MIPAPKLELPNLDLLSAYDYELPPELIAQHPLETRDASRMLVIHRATGRIEHTFVRELPSFLRPNDLLVVNNSRVVRARLQGVRTATGGQWEGLFLGLTESGEWNVIGQTRGRLEAGESLTIPAPSRSESTENSTRELANEPPPPESQPLELHLISRGEGGVWHVRPSLPQSPWELLDHYGSVPLPPYIHRATEAADDRVRYQTIFSGPEGSVAAPTAGLHFTPDLRSRCEQQGANFAEVTLHVGMGTFRPVNCERLEEHLMHTEVCELPEPAASAMKASRSAGGRILAVGTTSARTLESAAKWAAADTPWQGSTDLFIRPPYAFRQLDGLLTNFHVPKSTLLMLVCALAGHDLVMQAYQEARDRQYRFLSYGDCMLIL